MILYYTPLEFRGLTTPSTSSTVQCPGRIFSVKDDSISSFFESLLRPTAAMKSNEAKPPLNWINVIIFLGFPIAAIVLVPLWGFYQGYTGTQWAWALAFLYLKG